MDYSLSGTRFNISELCGVYVICFDMANGDGGGGFL
jgi:hypothetical protein